MIFQDPLSSLHPVLPGRLADRGDDPGPRPGHLQGAARPGRRAAPLVGIPQPDRRVDDYPHQFSGGMRQRAMIAMAMALEPVAADRRRADDGPRCHRAGPDPHRDRSAAGPEFDTAVILITHDLGVIAETADDVVGDVRRAGSSKRRPRRRRSSTAITTPTPRELLRSLPGHGASGTACSRFAASRPASSTCRPAASSTRAART